MGRYVRRIVPFGSGDIPAVQRWLEDMAEKGLFFREDGILFSKFEKGEPKKMRYRLDFCDVAACDIPDDKKEFYEHSGWQVVGDYKNDFVVVCTDDPDAAELYTEPELLVKPLKKLAREHLFMALIFLVMALCTQLTPFLGSMWQYGEDMLDFLLNIKAVYAVLVIVMALLLLTEAAVQLRIWLRLRRLAAEAAPSAAEPGSRAAAGYVITAIGLPLAVVWIVHWLCPVTAPNLRLLPDDVSGIGIPTAEEVIQLGTYDRRTEVFETADAFLTKKIVLSQAKDLRDSDGQLSGILQYSAEYREAPTALIAKDYFSKRMAFIKAEYDNSILISMNELSRVRLMGYGLGNVPYYRQEQYEEDGAEVFWQYYNRGDSRDVYGINRLVIRYENKVMDVYCDGNSDFYDHIPEYIDCLKSAK